MPLAEGHGMPPRGRGGRVRACGGLSPSGRGRCGAGGLARAGAWLGARWPGWGWHAGTGVREPGGLDRAGYPWPGPAGMWWTMRVPFIPTHPTEMLSSALTGKATGIALSGIGQTDESEVFAALASLITHLLVRLSYSDPALGALAKSLRAMGILGTSVAESRTWPLNEVYSDGASAQLMQELFKHGYDFHGTAYF